MGNTAFSKSPSPPSAMNPSYRVYQQQANNFSVPSPGAQQQKALKTYEKFAHLLNQLEPQFDISQFNGDYLIQNKDKVRINQGVVTFWIPDAEVPTVEGRLSVHKVNKKLTVLLTASFFNVDYRFFWTGKGENYIEWTHYLDLGKSAPIRWNRIPTYYPRGMPTTFNNPVYTYNQTSSGSKERLNSFSCGESDHSRGNGSNNRGSGHSSGTSDRCDSPTPEPVTMHRPKQDHNCKQKMLAQVGWDIIDRYHKIIIAPQKAKFLKNRSAEERKSEKMVELLHGCCDDVKPGLRGPCVFSIRAKKQHPELENTIAFLESMEKIATFKQLSLIFNSKRKTPAKTSSTKTINGKTVRRKQKKTVCVYVEVENKEELQAVLNAYQNDWKDIIGFCKVANENKEKLALVNARKQQYRV